MSLAKENEVKFWDMDLYENIFVFKLQEDALSLVISTIGDAFYASDMGGALYTFAQINEQGVYSDEK